MVPAHSIKVSRVSMYSGYRHVISSFAYGAFTLSGRLSQNLSAGINESILRSEPRNARIPVWPLSISLAATLEIDVSFSSSPSLDVSVQAVPLHTLWIGVWMHEVCSCGFPHSDIRGSLDICSFPRLFAAYHVFLRLLVPRHPPCALFCLTSSFPFSIALENGVLTDRSVCNPKDCYQLLDIGLLFSDVLIKIFSSKSLYEVFKVQTSLLRRAVEVASQLLSVDNIPAIFLCQIFI